MPQKILALFLLLLAILWPPPGQAQTLNDTTSWIGNTFGGSPAPGQPHQHVPLAADALFVLPDGTCYTNTPWDENGAEVAFYKGGDVLGSAGHTHGWGYGGGTEVTANRRYLFFAQDVGNEGGGLKDAGTWPTKGRTWCGISRRTRDGSPAPFPGGKGGAGDTLKQNFLLLTDAPDGANQGVGGLAADETHLYISDSAAGRVAVYDPETMAQTGGWPLARPGRIALAADGTLWIIQRGAGVVNPRLVHVTRQGVMLPGAIAGIADPTALCLGTHGRLLVADDGPAQQIRLYDVRRPRPRFLGTLGTPGGILGGEGPQIGRAGPLRFNHLTGVGCDALGHVYVASSGSVAGGGTVLESYAPSGKRLWRLLGLEFIDCAEPDPASETDVYTKEEHFTMDYARPAGRQWSYRGYTVNRFKYPDDPRLHTGTTSVFVRRIGGKRFLFTTDMYSGELAVFRFQPGTDGEVAVPAAMFAKGHFKPDDQSAWPARQPEKGEWLWHDGNGDGRMQAGEFAQPGAGRDAPNLWGWSVDSRGDVWQATDRDGLREFPCLGLDAHGSPRYSYGSLKTIPMPTPFVELCRAEYLPGTDTMFLSGYTTERPHKGGEWGTVGTEVIRYDHWGLGKPAALRIVLPYDGKKEPQVYIKAMCVAGDYVFAAESRDPERVFVYDARTGALQGTMQPDETVGKSSGWVDTPYGIRAARRVNGEYLVFVEEDLDAKVLLYCWTPARSPGIEVTR